MSDAFSLTVAEDRLLPWKRIREITGLSRTTVWRRQKAGDFPAPVVISPGRVGWRESEIAAWASSRRIRSAASDRPPSQSPEPEPAGPDTATPVRKSGPTAFARPTSRPPPRVRRGAASDQIRFDF
jgi:predicted DNA-binding transcriptional regulator AlpA